MRKRKQQTKLSLSQSHRDALLRNLAQELIRHRRIVTTLPKAKALRPFVEPLVSQARTGGMNARRLVERELYDSSVIDMLMNDVAPLYVGRPGGYTRIIKLGARRGDGAEEAIIEFVAVAKTEKNIKTHDTVN